MRNRIENRIIGQLRAETEHNSDTRDYQLQAQAPGAGFVEADLKRKIDDILAIFMY